MQGPVEVRIQFVEFSIKEAARWVQTCGTAHLQAVGSLQWLSEEGWGTPALSLSVPGPHLIVKAGDIDTQVDNTCV